MPRVRDPSRTRNATDTNVSVRMLHHWNEIIVKRMYVTRADVVLVVVLYVVQGICIYSWVDYTEVELGSRDEVE